MSSTYQIEVNDMNWSVMLNRALRAAVPEVDKRSSAISVHVHEDGHLTYQVSREAVPAVVLAKAFGVSEDAVAKSPRIVLKPIRGDENWQKPTVDYWGEG